HYMLASGCHAWVGGRLNHHLAEWPAGWQTAFGLVPRLVHVVEGGCNHDAAAMLRRQRLAGERAKVRQLAKGEIDLAARPNGAQGGDLRADFRLNSLCRR